MVVEAGEDLNAHLLSCCRSSPELYMGQ